MALRDMDADAPLELELQQDLEAIADRLWTHSQWLLRRDDKFLPHAAVLTESGEVNHVGAGPPGVGGAASASHALHMLHEGLRIMAEALPVKAIGIAERVTLAHIGEGPAAAIRIHFEHKRGLAVAWYLPFRKNVLRRYVLAPRFSRRALPIVHPWT